MNAQSGRQRALGCRQTKEIYSENSLYYEYKTCPAPPRRARAPMSFILAMAALCTARETYTFDFGAPVPTPGLSR